MGPTTLVDLRRWLESGLVDERYLVMPQHGSVPWRPIQELLPKAASGKANPEATLEELDWDKFVDHSLGASQATSASTAGDRRQAASDPARLADRRSAAPQSPSGGAAPVTDPLLERHLRSYLGPVATVQVDPSRDALSVDVLGFAASATVPHPYWVTCGVSRRALEVAQGESVSPWIEFCLGLPASWDFRQANWPVEWLRIAGRFSHETDQPLGIGTLIPNGVGLEPFVPGSSFCGWIVATPKRVAAPVTRMTLGKNKTLQLLSLIALQRDEFEYGRSHGHALLLRRLDEAKVTECLQPDRPSLFT